MPNDSGSTMNGSWSPVGSEEFESEMVASLGPLDAYEIVGPPGARLREPVRDGDVIVRNDPGAGPLIARVVAPGLHGREVFPFGADAEDEGEGVYAEAVERRRNGWAAAPGYRRIANRNFVGRPGQIILRPVVGAGRPELQPATEPSGGPFQVGPGDGALALEPLGGGEEPPEDREDVPKPRRRGTTYDFSDEPVQVVVPVTTIATKNPEQEVDALVVKLGTLVAPYGNAYRTGLQNFQTDMIFASEQEARPRYFDASLKEIGKQILEHGIKLAFESTPILGQVVGAVKSVVEAWYEERERAAKAGGERRIADYIKDTNIQIDELVKALTRAINNARDPLIKDFQAAIAGSVPGQGKHFALTSAAAQFMDQLRKAVVLFEAAIPNGYQIQQLLTERFIGPARLTTYISQGGRQSATLYLEVSVYHDRSASDPWKVKKVGSCWTVPSLSPHPDRLATSLKSSILGQGKEVWRTNLPKMVHLNIEEEVTGPNEYRDGWIRFSADPANYEVRSNYGLPQFDQAWKITQIRAAALAVNDLTGSDT